MKLLTTLAIGILVFNAAFAGSGNPSKIAFPKSFTTVLKEKKFLFEPETAKVCACQILRVASNNENETLVALFAQGTNNGDLFANFATVASILEKEKKHMKAMFYTKIELAGNITAATPCSKLYKNIQVKYSNIKMYDVLDADALSDKKVQK